MGEMSKFELGVFLPIGNNGFLMSKTAPQYKPSFEMNKQIAILARASASISCSRCRSGAASAVRPDFGTPR